MNASRFIEQKISKAKQGYFSQIATKIGTVSIAVGIASIIVTSLSLEGLQKSVKDKLFSFHGHMQVVRHSFSKNAKP